MKFSSVEILKIVDFTWSFTSSPRILGISVGKWIFIYTVNNVQQTTRSLFNLLPFWRPETDPGWNKHVHSGLTTQLLFIRNLAWSADCIDDNKFCWFGMKQITETIIFLQNQLSSPLQTSNSWRNQYT